MPNQNKQTTTLFNQGRSGKQDCNLSATLFIIYVDKLAQTLDPSSSPSIYLTVTQVKYLLYACDLVLLSQTHKGL